MSVIHVDGLTKTYGDVVAVDNISFDVGEGEIVGLLGRNGAGKTTAVHAIAGSRRPDAGTVRVLGLDPTTERAALRTVLGVQPQHARVHLSLTVIELVRLFRSFYGRGLDPRRAIDLVGLGNKAGTRFENLSGGQQQRLSIALALIGRPRVVILDELTTGLDPQARRRLWDMVESLRDDGVTILLVSHHMDEVERLCDSLVLLDQGRVLAHGTVQDVVAEADATGLEDAFLALTGHRAGAAEEETEEAESW